MNYLNVGLDKEFIVLTICKYYVDNTFTILKRNDVEDFLKHLNTQQFNQPSILQWRLKMTTQFPFLTQLVIKDSEGRLTTSVYRKSTHTDQYLSYDSHHPPSV